MQKAKVGIVGAGNISAIYMKNATSLFPNIEVTTVADLDESRAKARAKEFGIPRVSTVAELLANQDIAIILNLTVPGAHFEVCKAALEAGKSVYVEKPLSISLAQGTELLKLARKKKLRLGGAPDTFLGAGIQTCLKLIREGVIGTPVSASAFMLGGGHEGWHPDPEFYYKKGGGPMFDMGPYYLTALVALLGPVESLSGSARITWPERTITSEPKRGSKIRVDVPTHVSALLEFASGAQANITTSFDVKGGTTHVPIEIYGSEATLQVPDPNNFGGPVLIRKAGSDRWEQIPVKLPFADNSRGIGLSDMAAGIQSGATHRASGELTLHVLEIMEGIHISAKSGKRYSVINSCTQPEAL